MKSFFLLLYRNCDDLYYQNILRKYFSFFHTYFSIELAVSYMWCGTTEAADYTRDKKTTTTT